MSRMVDAAPEPNRAPRPKLDGADPVRRVVAREAVVERGQVVVRQGDMPRAAHLLLEGQTCRYRLLPDGRRQITAILIPGDVCDLEAVMRGRADYSVEALAPSVLGEIPAPHVDDPDGADPKVRRALWRQLLRDEAIAREWMVGMGRRSARERMAHFVCEMQERMRKVGLGDGDRFGLDLTQAALADVLGLSTVHVNRVLQEFRRDGLVEFSGRVMHVIDHAALAKLAVFEPAYLEIA